MVSGDWKEALAPTPDCLALERLGEPLSDAQRSHVEGCVRCQTELALFRDMMSEESSPESQWIADELRRRDEKKVVKFRPRGVMLAIAAALAVFIGISAWMNFRETPLEIKPGTYRSARLEGLTPGGDIAQAPNELRWDAVPNATVYAVQILEVDASPVWSTRTADTHVALPQEVIARFAPGKTLLWEVRALRGTEEIAVSQTQNIRVIP